MGYVHFHWASIPGVAPAGLEAGEYETRMREEIAGSPRGSGSRVRITDARSWNTDAFEDKVVECPVYQAGCLEGGEMADVASATLKRPPVSQGSSARAAEPQPAKRNMKRSFPIVSGSG